MPSVSPRGQKNLLAACEIMDGLRFVASLKRLNIGYVAACDIVACGDNAVKPADVKNAENVVINECCL